MEGLLERARRADKKAEYAAQLECPPLPKAVAYLWRIFMRLSNRRGGGFGAAPITWADIDGFSRLTHCTLTPWEVEVIEELDGVFLANESKKQQDKLASGKKAKDKNG